MSCRSRSVLRLRNWKSKKETNGLDRRIFFAKPKHQAWSCRVDGKRWLKQGSEKRSLPQQHVGTWDRDLLHVDVDHGPILHRSQQLEAFVLNQDGVHRVGRAD